MDAPVTERIRLGGSDLKISPLGMGTNAWGADRKADPEKQATYSAALTAGINFIDTAEIYQFGASEQTIGLFLPGSRSQVVLATKFFPYPWRLSRASLVTALQASLKRLAVPNVDLYILHFPVPPVPLETWVKALAEVQRSGLTRAVGISNCNSAQTRRAHAVLAERGLPLASNQVEFSLLNRKAERSGLMATCRDLGVTLVAYRPLGYGLLTGKYTLENLPAYMHGRVVTRSEFQRVSPLLDLLHEIARGHGKTPSQVALNWIVCKGAVPIPGAKNPRQATENAAALGWRLSAEEVKALDLVSEPFS